MVLIPQNKIGFDCLKKKLGHKKSFPTNSNKVY